FGRKTFDISQDKHRPKARGQALNRSCEDILQLRLLVELFGIRAPIRDFTGNRILFGFNVLIQRDRTLGPTTAQFHQRLVDRYTHEPSIKLRLALKLFQVAVGLQEGILHHVFRVLAVLRDVLSDSKNVAIVSLDQFLERRYIAPLSRLNQRQFVAYGLTYFWLDGAHSWSDAVFSA